MMLTGIAGAVFKREGKLEPVICLHKNLGLNDKRAVKPQHRHRHADNGRDKRAAFRGGGLLAIREIRACLNF